MKKFNTKWRTSPRSITVLFNRLKYFFSNLYGKSKSPEELYNYKIPNSYYPKRSKPKYIHPFRRMIAYDCLKNELKTGEQQKSSNNKFVYQESKNQFAKGYQPAGDNADKESPIRQMATTAQQFGLMNSRTAKLTPVGLEVCKNEFTSDDFICQLLKMYVIANKGCTGVFPFEIFLDLMKKYKYLSINELTFLFGALTRDDIPKVIKAVGEFREKYHDRSIIPRRTDKRAVDTLIINVWNHYFHHLDDYHNMPKGKARKKAKGTFYSLNHDYPDALKNSLFFTGIFDTTGYGQFKLIKVRKWTAYKFNDLLKYDFAKSFKEISPQVPARNNLKWFGSNNIHLLWQNPKELRSKIKYKVTYLNKLVKPEVLKKYSQVKSNKKISLTELEHIDNDLNKLAAKSNWFKFIHKAPKSKTIHHEILEILDEISDNTFDDGSPALWLENITVKALASIGSRSQDLRVNYYGHMDPDLKPKSFAAGGCPDISADFDDTRFIVEVSLMNGVQQWEHEASSVISHISQEMSNHNNKKVYGIFISNQTNTRTWWQYFILNKDSWLGKPIHVAPLTISQFVSVLRTIYNNKNLDIYDLNQLVSSIIKDAYMANKYQQWEQDVPNIIKSWKIKNNSKCHN